ncbi:MAG TPA: response regulator [Terriglobales bacterium]|nr:response regulator [Terriglobales bacterium]
MDKIRALIVDDSSVMRKIVERSLRQAGIELEKVVEASNGAEALAALQSNVVDLILCDINMPVMDGLEFVRQVATVESAKGVDVVILGHAPTDVALAQAGLQSLIPAQIPIAASALMKTTQKSPVAPPNATVVSTAGGH